ncbi:hypothetical protein GGX14DRAFT_418925 [Mycena pura]|uniref:PIN domain-like protein n=1 Tax=Mycena pura TaxID=153505 RepID=A0AAD6YRW5_9AGAR|nr:hypothetical protein GGX14DRAFT_418925 [Mycena pura]
MGVKSLWKLLAPVGRPVMLETLEGQILAIDSSIWIYQFQATMRDNDGRALSNAHVLGFLRRIAKLLFYGIKPVFVFDGGAPALKRNTLNERKQKKSGAATSHVKLAEKLLAAQLRREALNQAKGSQKPSKGKGKAPSGPVVLDDNTIYLEDIDGSAPKSPVRKSATEKLSAASPNKPRFHDHDPYRLPDVDLEAVIAEATRAAVPDPRLATEDELRMFIENMRPEDFDVTSPAFRELPTEIQYEIVGDLRLKSRQMSHARLQNMLRSSHTPLDFSKQQILNLRQRNTLTQQLLMTTDSIGKAHLTIPVRVASERNREYLLIKNDGQDGGWILGIRDDGTREKPIEIDHGNNKVVSDIAKAIPEDDSDDEMEEVPIPQAGVPDADLQEYQRSMALGAIASRQGPKKFARPSKNPPEAMPQPLFELDNDNDVVPIIDDDDDGALAFAIQESMDRATVTPQMPTRPQRPAMVNAVASSSKLGGTTPRRASGPVPNYSLDDEFVHGNRLETALSIANAGHVRTPTKPVINPNPTLEEPLAAQPQKTSAIHSRAPQSRPAVQAGSGPSGSLFGEPVLLQPKSSSVPPVSLSRSTTRSGIDVHGESKDGLPELQVESEAPSSGGDVVLQQSQLSRPAMASPSTSRAPVEPSDDSDEEMEEVLPVFAAAVAETVPPLIPFTAEPSSAQSEHAQTEPSVDEEQASVPDSITAFVPPSVTTMDDGESLPSSGSHTLLEQIRVEPSISPSPVVLPTEETAHQQSPLKNVDELGSEWSRSPSPVVGLEHRSSSPVHEDWDAAQEMDADAEEGEFARFISQVKGKDLDEVRRDIDNEIQVLNAQKKAAMRDSEDINQQMVSQIMMMLNLFGIPYITAPMEAEAQCAELVHLGLVNGVITDDSDVFLFGSPRVYKNMFNQSKTVECFLLSDLSRELGLDRDTLIRLAYLLGSDYVEGLPGVGPVVAMELVDEFPGEDGLHKFKEWWIKVQTGKDKPEDNNSKFRKRFKKKFKELYLPPEWPNALVRDAYYHPTVDESEEPFKWGLPDLDALREFLYVELHWSPEKADELLLPVIQKIRKRGQAGALNKQGNLNGFFDVTGSGTVAPRQRQAYASKRLQQVVSDFRKKRKHSSKSPAMASQSGGSPSEDDDDMPTKKRAKKGKAKADGKSRRGATRGRGRGVKKGSSRKLVSDDESDFDAGDMAASPGPELAAQLRPRPKPAYKGAAVDAQGGER